MRPTQWRVITGAPCAGKTSVIEALSRRGFAVVHEAARALIDEALARGRRLEAIKSDPLAFETAILQRKIAMERELDPDRTVFLDRAVPDSIAYFLLEGLDPAAARRQSRHFRYGQVFVFDPLPFVADRVRSEDADRAERLGRLLEESYTALGYRPVRVPVMPVSDRADFIVAQRTSPP